MAKHGYYVAKKSFVTNIDGRRVHVRRGRIAEKGSRLLEMFPEAFREMEPDYPRERQVEQATAGPGEKRTTVFPPEPPRPDGLRHVGGGVFETPDGERFRGRADALAHMNPEED